MNTRIIYLLTALLLGASLTVSPVHAKSLGNIDKVTQASEQFMQQVTQGDTESALSLISAYLGVDPKSFMQRSATIMNDMQRIEQQAGKALSYAALEPKQVGEHFYKTRYLLKYKQAALIWELNFYQPEEGWGLVDVSFNTDIDALFE